MEKVVFTKSETNATTHDGNGNKTPATSLVEMARGYFRSCILCAAARLEIADALGGKERTVEELAVACGTNADSLHRLLRALASIGVTAETAPGRFVLTPFGEPLRKDAPHSVWPSVVFWSDLLADNWSYLTDCIRTGDTAAHLMESQGIASRWSKDPNAGAIFRAVMGTAPAEDYMPIVRSWDFAGRQVIADLGGGGGALISAVLKCYPELEGILVDRQPSIDEAIGRFAAEGLTNRCRLMASDLQEGVPAGADVYLMKHVLHGYRDDGAINILRNCRSVIPPDGYLLVIEFVLPNVVSQADPAIEGRLMSDLNMMAVTGGKERNAAEWTKLLQCAGFELRQIIPVAGEPLTGWEVSIIEGVPMRIPHEPQQP